MRFLPYSEFEKEVQGKSAKAPAYEKVLAHFLAKRKVKSALVPANFPLGFARELEANKIRRSTRRAAFSGRSAKRRPKRNCG